MLRADKSGTVGCAGYRSGNRCRGRRSCWREGERCDDDWEGAWDFITFAFRSREDRRGGSKPKKDHQCCLLLLRSGTLRANCLVPVDDAARDYHRRHCIARVLRTLRWRSRPISVEETSTIPRPRYIRVDSVRQTRKTILIVKFSNDFFRSLRMSVYSHSDITSHRFVVIPLFATTFSDCFWGRIESKRTPRLSHKPKYFFVSHALPLFLAFRLGG